MLPFYSRRHPHQGVPMRPPIHSLSRVTLIGRGFACLFFLVYLLEDPPFLPVPASLRRMRPGLDVTLAGPSEFVYFRALPEFLTCYGPDDIVRFVRHVDGLSQGVVYIGSPFSKEDGFVVGRAPGGHTAVDRYSQVPGFAQVLATGNCAGHEARPPWVPH